MHSFGSYKREWFTTGIIWLSALIIIGMFFWLVGGILWEGTQRITLEFLTSKTLNAGRSGGNCTHYCFNFINSFGLHDYRHSHRDRHSNVTF